MHDAYLAKTIRLSTEGRPWIGIEVNQIEPALGIAESALKPPPEARLASPRRVNVASGVMVGNLISKVNPHYPAKARMSHTKGTVVLQAVINREGSITDLRVVSGPQLLQPVSMDAVKKWRYDPYLLNGEAVEVETQINVDFSMGPT